MHAETDATTARRTAKRAALYVRVSSDHQTVQNQIEALTEIAMRRGWQIVATYQDAGISGTKGRDKRPGLDAMLNDASRGKFDVVMAWALDRLGRSLIDLLASVQHLHECDVGLYIEKFSGDQAVDTTSSVGRFMFVIFAGLAEFERSMIRDRVRAGVKRARAAGIKFGRPKIDYTVEKRIRAALAKGDKGMLKIAEELGVGSGTVQRIAREMRT
jgi:DNA invertase Pin-like site-specific DNA recombinase